MESTEKNSVDSADIPKSTDWLIKMTFQDDVKVGMQRLFTGPNEVNSFLRDVAKNGFLAEYPEQGKSVFYSAETLVKIEAQEIRAK